MANCAITGIANALQIFVWLPLLAVWGFLSGVLFNLASCFRRPHYSAGAASSRNGSSVAGWCKQGPEGFDGIVGKAVLACQSDSDDDDQFFNCAQMCVGLCATFGWATTIALSLPGCIVHMLRQAFGTAAPAVQQSEGDVKLENNSHDHNNNSSSAISQGVAHEFSPTAQDSV